MSKPEKDTTLDRFWDVPLQDLLGQLQATPAGLTSDEARQRLRLHGPNSLVGESRFAALTAFLTFFANPLVVILLAAAAISIVLGDPVGGSIIIAIVLLSVWVTSSGGSRAEPAWEASPRRVLPPPRFCAMEKNWRCRSPSWSPAISFGSMRGTWRRPTPVYWTPRICTRARARSPGNLWPSTRRRALCRRGRRT